MVFALLVGPSQVVFLENQVIEHLIFVEQIQVTESKSGKKNL
jgi:hypothetical protein